MNKFIKKIAIYVIAPLVLLSCGSCNTTDKKENSSFGNGQKLPIDEVTEPEIWFPEIKDFSEIDSDLQSIDPDLYNFQFWTTKNGIYIYAIQKTTHLKNDDSDCWKNTHFECEIWNNDFGYGWDGTYVSLFLNDDFYVNNWNNLKGIYYLKNMTSNGDLVTIKYYMYLEFPNNGGNKDQPYAYIKPYQFMPGETPTNSQVVLRDDRNLITGYESSFQVHDVIDKYMTE